MVFFSPLVLDLHLRTSLTFLVLNDLDLIQFNYLELGEGIKLIFYFLFFGYFFVFLKISILPLS